MGLEEEKKKIFDEKASVHALKGWNNLNSISMKIESHKARNLLLIIK